MDDRSFIRRATLRQKRRFFAFSILRRYFDRSRIEDAN